jgi:hypothetical protein
MAKGAFGVNWGRGASMGSGRREAAEAPRAATGGRAGHRNRPEGRGRSPQGSSKPAEFEGGGKRSGAAAGRASFSSGCQIQRHRRATISKSLDPKQNEP